jgi:hypothetical protein
VHQVGCKISILYHDARSKIHQIKFLMFCSGRPIPLSFGDLFAIINSGTVNIRSGLHTSHSRAPSYQSWFYQAIISTLKMGKESGPETF